jgi:hypothetical protein
MRKIPWKARLTEKNVVCTCLAVAEVMPIRSHSLESSPWSAFTQTTAKPLGMSAS